MSWKDRIAPASYTSPSGLEITFLYEDVSRKFARHTAAYDFPDVDGSFIQDLGRSGRRFPLSIFFAGPDYDIEANKFDGMLEEQGVGTLTHPMYGPTPFKVVPFGSITRTDRLKTAGNQAKFEVTFYETNGLLFPSEVASPGDDTREAVGIFLAESPKNFSEGLVIESPVEKLAVTGAYRGALDKIKAGLKSVAAVQANIEQEFNRITKAINSDIDTLVGTPLTLASQMVVLAQLPARSIALISDRLTAYSSLLTSLTGRIYSQGGDKVDQNKFVNDDFMAANMLTGSVTSVLENSFSYKVDALSAADTVVSMCDEWNTWRDTNLQSLDVIDTGADYAQVSKACALAAGFLVQISFSLKQERVTTLERAETILNLEARLYRTVDENFDFLVQSNELVGQEILEVPKGRRIVYYV